MYLLFLAIKEKDRRQGRPIDKPIVSYLAGGLSRISGITAGECSGEIHRRTVIRPGEGLMQPVSSQPYRRRSPLIRFWFLCADENNISAQYAL